MAKILLIAGHGAGDPGAIGNGTSEAVETRRVVNALVSPLKNNGMDVNVYDQNKNAFAEAQAGRLNFGGTFDYVFEVHFNSFNSQAKGTEAFITSSESSDSIEQDIVKRLSKYFVSRGVKRTNFSVIYNAKLQGMSSCLYEMCFIDNAADMQAYNNNFSSIINDIANAIAAGFGKSSGTGNVSNSEEQSKPTVGDNQNSNRKGRETTMQCLYERPINPKTGKLENNGSATTVMYCNGANCRRLYHDDETKVIQLVYRENNGKEIPFFKANEWNKQNPWYVRLEAACPVIK